MVRGYVANEEDVTGSLRDADLAIGVRVLRSGDDQSRDLVHDLVRHAGLVRARMRDDLVAAGSALRHGAGGLRTRLGFPCLSCGERVRHAVELLRRKL